MLKLVIFWVWYLGQSILSYSFFFLKIIIINCLFWRISKLTDGPEGGCRICSLDEHHSTLCPYNKSHIRKNAIVGRGCDVVCKVCHALFSGRCCNQDLGCARLKFCYCCLKYDEHWSEGCPCMISYNAGTFIITSSEYLKGKSVGQSCLLRQCFVVCGKSWFISFNDQTSVLDLCTWTISFYVRGCII